MDSNGATSDPPLRTSTESLVYTQSVELDGKLSHNAFIK